MQPFNRLPNSGRNSPSSPPHSPRRSPKLRHSRSKHPARFTAAQSPPATATTTLSRRLVRHRLFVFVWRQGIFLFALLLYIAGMLFYLGTLSFDVLPFFSHHPGPPGSVYRSPQLYAKLKHEMDADNSTADAISTIWKHSRKGGAWRPCTNKSSGRLPESNGYIYVEANGGLNQQRSSICNAVAVGWYLNATLVIPSFHFHSIWRDSSEFKDIYDEGFFLNTLENDVRVVDKIPGYLMERFDQNVTNIFNFKVKAWAPIQYYKDTVLPTLLEENCMHFNAVERAMLGSRNFSISVEIQSTTRVHVIHQVNNTYETQPVLPFDKSASRVIRISPFANRLAFDAPLAVQRLRCLANYEALRFSSPILNLGESLVAKMKGYSTKNNGKYISVHLRFEEDMVAFSCCVYDGGRKADEGMKAARERGWRGKFTRAGRVIRPGANRINGKCPPTPLEVGLMLRGMGFDNSTSIYLASGVIYNSENNIRPLLEMFPLLQTKETLASDEELAPFKNFSSRMAAIDYSVCLHSEVFVTTQGGNFPQFLIGHRRYLFGGHKDNQARQAETSSVV